MWIHIGTHPALMQIWLFPFVFGLAENVSKGRYGYVKFSLGLLSAILVSNYLGFMILFGLCTKAFMHILTQYISKKTLHVRSVKIFLLSIFTALLVFFYFSFGSFNRAYVPQRSYEDLFHF